MYATARRRKRGFTNYTIWFRTFNGCPMACRICHESNSVRYVQRGSAFEPVPCSADDPRAEPCECGFGALRCCGCTRPVGEGAFTYGGETYCDACALAVTEPAARQAAP